MKTVFIVCAFLVVAAAGQHVHPINWREVAPVYELPSFFDRFPNLRVAYLTLGGLNQYSMLAGYEAFSQPPHQVGIVSHFTDGNGFCSGTLISQNYVLTNAHCILGAYSVIVIAGASNLTNHDEATQQKFFSREFVIHPNWLTAEVDELNDDFGLIKLPFSAVLTPSVQILRLPTVFQLQATFAEYEGIMTGWGSRNILGMPDFWTLDRFVPRFTEANLTSVFSCRLTYPTLFDSSRMFCAEPEDFNGSACPNEGGSSFYIRDYDGQDTLIGMTTFASSFGCSRGRQYLVHRITEYLFWIVSMSDVELRFY